MKATLKYLRRVIKSLIWFLILFAIMVAIIVLIVPEYTFGMVFKEGGMFVPGSEIKIIILFLAISAVYPAVKYVKKEAIIKGTFEDSRDKIFETFTKLGYVFVSEDDQTVVFRLAKKYLRFMRMYEDKISITKGESPLILKGDRKEIIRIGESIMYAVNSTDNPEEVQFDDPFDYKHSEPDKEEESKEQEPQKEEPKEEEPKKEEPENK